MPSSVFSRRCDFFIITSLATFFHFIHRLLLIRRLQSGSFAPNQKRFWQKVNRKQAVLIFSAKRACYSKSRWICHAIEWWTNFNKMVRTCSKSFIENLLFKLNQYFSFGKDLCGILFFFFFLVLLFLFVCCGLYKIFEVTPVPVFNNFGGGELEDGASILCVYNFV